MIHCFIRVDLWDAEDFGDYLTGYVIFGGAESAGDNHKIRAAQRFT